MTLADIRPLLIATVLSLAALSAVRNHFQRTRRSILRIPVRFEPEAEPQGVAVRRKTAR